MNKILLCPLSTFKNKDTRQKVFLDYCSTKTNCLFLSDFHSETNICLSSNNSYTSCVEKILNSFDYLSRLYYDWFFYCDDDTFVNEDKMNEFITGCSKESSYGHILNVGSDPKNPIWNEIGRDFRYFSGGAGFLVSKQTITTLSKASTKNLPSSRFSDVTMGFLFRELNLPMIDEGRFNPLCCDSYRNKDNKEQITFHYMTEDKIKKI